MKLEVLSLWSPDLTPVDSGRPEDLSDFSIGLRVNIGEVNQEGGETFSLTVCTPSRLAQTESGTFVIQTLVLERFDWALLNYRLGKLMRHCEAAGSWPEAIARLAPYLLHDGG